MKKVFRHIVVILLTTVSFYVVYEAMMRRPIDFNPKRLIMPLIISLLNTVLFIKFGGKPVKKV